MSDSSRPDAGRPVSANPVPANPVSANLGPAIAVPFFLARPAAPGPGPGVVVLLEGNGMHAQLLRVCQRLATEGYTAIAPDLFWRFGGSDPAKMPSQFMALRSDDALADIAECVAELHRLGVTKVGVTGFCMGGRLAYETATKMLDGIPIDVQAAAPFYGATIGTLLAEPHCPILCFFGGTDDYIPPEEIAAVQAFHDGDVVVYPQAGHGFMRDGSDSYDEVAATDAWPKLLDFFAQHLR